MFRGFLRFSGELAGGFLLSRPKTSKKRPTSAFHFSNLEKCFIAKTAAIYSFFYFLFKNDNDRCHILSSLKAPDSRC